MFCEATAEHGWLQRMVGSWTYEHAWTMEPGGDPGRTEGTEVVRAFGDLWVIADAVADCEGTTMHTVMSLGFDPKAAGGAGRYVGSFIASMMGGMFVYEGTREGDVLTLDTEGPHLTDPDRITTYRDVIELVGDDVRRMSSRALMEDGSWFRFMEGEYRRSG
jgi:hypothetical protein